MKIERISDDQIKIMLDRADLKERKIKLDELSYGSEKTQTLFREMMEQAYEKYNFEVGNVPVMIEAIPQSLDSIVIIVTKVKDAEGFKPNANFIPGIKNRFINRGTDTKNTKAIECKSLVYSFTSLDDIMNATRRIKDFCGKECYVYKYQSKYILFIDHQTVTTDKLSLVNIILSEFGTHNFNTRITKYFLDEYGDVIVKNDAVKKLSNI